MAGDIFVFKNLKLHRCNIIIRFMHAEMRVIFMLSGMVQTRYDIKLCVSSDTDDNGFYRETPSKWKGVTMEKSLPMNLQFFAESAAGAPEGGEPQKQEPAAGAPAIDYAKIQQMLDGTLAAKEDTALKAYFKQQGLSQEEAEQAMSAFKTEKAKNQPDIGVMQTQLSQARAEVLQAKIQSMATMEAVSLGIEPKTIPYVLKMADLSKVSGQDGAINSEEVKSALNKVLEDVPALKPQIGQASGFTKVGAPGGTQQLASDDALKAAFGL